MAPHESAIPTGASEPGVALPLLTQVSVIVQRLTKRQTSSRNDKNASWVSSATLATSNATVYDSILGAALTLGISITLLQISSSLVKRTYFLLFSRDHNPENKKGSQPRFEFRKRRKKIGNSFSWYHYIMPLFLAEMLANCDLDSNINEKSDGHNNNFDNYSEEDSDCITLDSNFQKPDSFFASQRFGEFGKSSNQNNHQQSASLCDQIFSGSCHCRAVQFILRQPPIQEEINSSERLLIEAHDSPGKIRYPRVPLSAASTQFELTPSSLVYLKTYLVETADSAGTDSAAHAFCTVCGVHILYAPNSKLDVVEVNGNCLDLTQTSGGMPASLNVMWRPEIQSQTQRMCAQGAKSDSVSTNMTEATTITLSSGIYDHQSIRYSEQTRNIERELYDRKSNGFVNKASSSGTSLPGHKSVSDGFMASASTSEIMWEESVSSPLFSMSDNESLVGKSLPENVRFGIKASFNSTPTVTGTTSSRKKKRLGMDSPAKQNLMHYMRRHLVSPREIDEESQLKGSEI